MECFKKKKKKWKVFVIITLNYVVAWFPLSRERGYVGNPWVRPIVWKCHCMPDALEWNDCNKVRFWGGSLDYFEFISSYLLKTRWSLDLFEKHEGFLIEPLHPRRCYYLKKVLENFVCPRVWFKGHALARRMIPIWRRRKEKWRKGTKGDRKSTRLNSSH